MTVQIKGQDSPATVNVAHEAFEQFMTPDYFVHAVRLQGGECKIVRVMPGNGTTSLESGYSMTSRCIEKVFLYLNRETHCPEDDPDADPIDTIVRRWHKARPKLSARRQASQYKHRREHTKVDPRLDHGPTRPMNPPGDAAWAAPMHERPWERKKKRRKFVVDQDGQTIGLV